MSVAAFIAAVAPAIALMIPAVQQRESGPMAAVGIAYVLITWWLFCWIVGIVSGLLGLIAAKLLKESRTVSAVGVAMNLALLLYFFATK